MDVWNVVCSCLQHGNAISNDFSLSFALSLAAPKTSAASIHIRLNIHKFSFMIKSTVGGVLWFGRFFGPNLCQIMITQYVFCLSTSVLCVLALRVWGSFRLTLRIVSAMLVDASSIHHPTAKKGRQHSGPKKTSGPTHVKVVKLMLLHHVCAFNALQSHARTVNMLERITS